jgi:hypothetical protein
VENGEASGSESGSENVNEDEPELEDASEYIRRIIQEAREEEEGGADEHD